jgi:hypothetical protein
MRRLAKGAIRMIRTVCMDVRQLYRRTKEQKERDERKEQKASWRILRPNCPHPSHNYCSI